MCLLQASRGIYRGRLYALRVGSATRDGPTHRSTAYSCDREVQRRGEEVGAQWRKELIFNRFSYNRGLAAGEEVGEDDGGDGLDYYGGAEGEADIVAAGDI